MQQLLDNSLTLGLVRIPKSHRTRFEQETCPGNDIENTSSVKILTVLQHDAKESAPLTSPGRAKTSPPTHDVPKSG